MSARIARSQFDGTPQQCLAFVWLTKLTQCCAEIAAGLGIVCVEPQRGAEARDGIAIAPQQTQRAAQIVVNRRHIRPLIGKLLPAGGGLCEATLRDQGLGALRQSAHIRGTGSRRQQIRSSLN
jgi:hypothetical protein